MAIMRSYPPVGNYMDFFTIAKYLYNHLDFTISVCCSVVFLVVNIIQAIRSHNLSKLKEALSNVPQVIRDVEKLFAGSTSIEKKASARALLSQTYGKLYKKNVQVFDDAIEDVLNTPQKKGD